LLFISGDRVAQSELLSKRETQEVVMRLTRCARNRSGGNWRRAAGASLFAIAILLAASCAKPAPKEHVALRLWCIEDEGFEAGYKALIEKYVKVHPEVSVTLAKFEYSTYIQTLQTSFPANSEADVLQLFGTWVGGYKDRLTTVPASILTAAKARESILSSTLGGYIFGDELYGVPEEFNMEAGAVLVNTDMARKAGVLDAIAGWKTWDDVIAAMRKLSVIESGSMTRAGMCFTTRDGLAYTFLSLTKQFGGAIIDAKGDFDPAVLGSSAARRAIALMKSMVDAKLVDPKLYNENSNYSGEALMKGQAASAVIGAWAIPQYGADYKDVLAALKYFPLPTVSPEPAFIAASGWGLSVSKNCKSQAVAWDFVRFAALDAKNAMEWNIAAGTLPALKANTEGEGKKALLASFPQFDVHLGLMRYGQPQGHMKDSDKIVYEIIADGILSYLQGNEGVDELVSKMVRQATEVQSK
jgi:ABC-type glycerol-3-phosphate transport system substrate-binding protein